MEKREINYFFKHCYTVLSRPLIIFLCQQVFIMFSIIVSLLFEILALSLFKGMHLVLCDTIFFIRVLCDTLISKFTLFSIFCFSFSSFFFFFFFSFLFFCFYCHLDLCVTIFCFLLALSHFPFNELSFFFP